MSAIVYAMSASLAGGIAWGTGVGWMLGRKSGAKEAWEDATARSRAEADRWNKERFQPKTHGQAGHICKIDCKDPTHRETMKKMVDDWKAEGMPTDNNDKKLWFNE